jgi:type VI secretion system protein ImpF
MVELSLKERLQPALFDRLIDDERHITTYRIEVRTDALHELKLKPDELLGILRAQGLREEGGESGQTTAETLTWLFTASSAVAPSQLKSCVIKPPGAPEGVELQTFCTIESRTALNGQIELGAKHMISVNRLRECVQRDLAWLLNTSNLAVVQDLSRYPRVARSVLNYGMPSLAGRAVASIEPQVAAKRILEVIATYEPRLSRIRVTPEPAAESDEMLLAFRIDAELWGQPASQHVVLRTTIDVGTGDVGITEAR